MSRFFKRLFFALVTLGLGAFCYALLRAEARDEAGAAGGSADAGSPAPSGRPAAAAGRREEPSTTEPRACAGKTRSGKRCSRPAQPGSRYCWQHGG
ncbi:MAG: hypothetical protein PVG07_13000 [Acidobacteriota bacterium]|jgi:hypothetical protein